MSKSLGIVLTTILILGALGAAGCAVYNSTHRGDAALTLSLAGVVVLMFTTAAGLWADKPGGLDAQARATLRDFSLADARPLPGAQVDGPSIGKALRAAAAASGSPPLALLALLAALAVSAAACSAPLVHQQRLGELHSRAAGACRTRHLTCAALAPCSSSVRASIADWQAVSAAVSRGDEDAEAGALVAAASSEVAARAVCKAAAAAAGGAQ